MLGMDGLGGGGANPMMMASSGMGQIGQGLGWFFGSYDNPADEAMPYLQNIPGQTGQYFEPYINAGKSALPQLQSQYGSLTSDPAAFMKKLGMGYQQSPGFEFQKNQ